jgi:small nuclear ribonucleoprotein (snRNP)-like protein
MSNKTKASGVWGETAPQFYKALKEEEVLVCTVGEKKLRGVLIGVDAYNIVIRQESGLKVMLNKGNIVYVHRYK